MLDKTNLHYLKNKPEKNRKKTLLTSAGGLVWLAFLALALIGLAGLVQPVVGTELSWIIQTNDKSRGTSPTPESNLTDSPFSTNKDD